VNLEEWGMWGSIGVIENSDCFPHFLD